MKTKRGKISKGVMLQQDNARVHTCKVAMDAVERNGYELIPHPAYLPDLAPSDFFLFPNLKKQLWSGSVERTGYRLRDLWLLSKTRYRLRCARRWIIIFPTGGNKITILYRVLNMLIFYLVMHGPVTVFYI